MKSLIKKEVVLDGIDKALLGALDRHARISVKALSRQVGLSAPSCGERLRQLERTVIRRYGVELDPQALGLSLQTLIRTRALPGQIQRLEQWLQATPECVQYFKVTGDDDFVSLMYLRSVSHLDQLLRELATMAVTHTSLIKGVERKLPAL